MSPDHTRLNQLLERLRELETARPAPHERAIFEASRIALCDEVSRLAHALNDTGYLRGAPAQRKAV